MYFYNLFTRYFLFPSTCLLFIYTFFPLYLSNVGLGSRSEHQKLRMKKVLDVLIILRYINNYSNYSMLYIQSCLWEFDRTSNCVSLWITGRDWTSQFLLDFWKVSLNLLPSTCGVIYNFLIKFFLIAYFHVVLLYYHHVDESDYFIRVCNNLHAFIFSVRFYKSVKFKILILSLL